MQRLVKPGSIAVDLGANYGVTASTLAQMVGKFGKLYAIEPDSQISAVLSLNMALNGFKQA